MHILQESLQNIWNKWEIRMMVLLSLSLQVILIILGSRRKYMVNRWLQIIVWLAYLSADTVASISLGILTHRQGDCNNNPNNVVQQLWFPFLLLHLGGPDTITAYSLEDNELWLRHFTTLVGQVAMAFYVFLTSKTPAAFTSPAIPIFVAGILKYGERTWVLRSASPNNFRNNVRQRLGERAQRWGKVNNPESNDFDEAYYLFGIGKYLFAGFPLILDDTMHGERILFKKSAVKMFHLVEIELGYVYDVMYTKASIIYSKQGIFLRLISFSCFIYSLTDFAIIIGKYDYSKIDIFITYLLLVGAILLEIYALYLVICSDWILVQPWLTRSRATFIPRTIYSVLIFLSTKRKRWSRTMAQHNLLKFCLETRIKKFRKQFATSEYAKQDVKDSLEEFLFQNIREKVMTCFGRPKAQKKLLAESFEQLLTKMGCLEDFSEYTIDVDFDHRLLVWHIGTCICDRMEGNHDNDLDKFKHEIGRSLSEYMLYLLVEYPQMLPNMSGQTSYLNACEHAKQVFKEKPKLAEAFKSKEESLNLPQFIEATEPTTDLNDKYSPQLKLGFKLAEKLQSQPNKWNLISEMWVEMLINAASHGEWRYHAQRLMKGGELLTHVALLMAHLGFSQHSKFGF